MMKTLNDTLEHCATHSGFPTYLYARMGEANVHMDEVTQFPAIVRAFNETIYETKIKNTRRRKSTLYFCDALGEAEPNTSYSVAPIIDKIEMRAFAFVDNMRHNNIEIEIQSATPFVGRFDALVAGIKMELTMTYSMCR